MISTSLFAVHELPQMQITLLEKIKEHEKKSHNKSARAWHVSDRVEIDEIGQ